MTPTVPLLFFFAFLAAMEFLPDERRSGAQGRRKILRRSEAVLSSGMTSRTAFKP
jgi:hypothetical protein